MAASWNFTGVKELCFRRIFDSYYFENYIKINIGFSKKKYKNVFLKFNVQFSPNQNTNQKNFLLIRFENMTERLKMHSIIHSLN